MNEYAAGCTAARKENQVTTEEILARLTRDRQPGRPPECECPRCSLQPRLGQLVAGAGVAEVMSVPRPEPGPLFSWAEMHVHLREAAQRGRRGLPPRPIAEIRASVARARSEHYLASTDIRFLTLGQAAMVLARSRAFARQLIIGGELLGEFVPAAERERGYSRWFIPVAEVRQLAEGPALDPFDERDPE